MPGEVGCITRGDLVVAPFNFCDGTSVHCRAGCGRSGCAGTRDDRACTGALQALTAAAASAPGERNVMEKIFEAARAYATEGEIRNAMREVYGDYTESAEF